MAVSKLEPELRESIVSQYGDRVRFVYFNKGLWAPANQTDPSGLNAGVTVQSEVLEDVFAINDKKKLAKDVTVLYRLHNVFFYLNFKYKVLLQYPEKCICFKA